MYFPYLRGRQFELLALRELLEKGVLSEKIVPVIEPVKLSTTLIKTMDLYNARSKKYGLIMNPQVGSFMSDTKEAKNEKLVDAFKESINKSESILYVVFLTQNFNCENFIQRHSDRIATICANRDAISVYEKYFTSINVNYTLLPDETVFRRKIQKNKVLLADKFNKQERNNDYITINEEPFSDEHLYYKLDGYVGFSDYSIVGKDYSETGFAPYAVAIHIVYFAEDNSLRVKHFVSDSNDDISNPAGKFQEALCKLIKWNATMRLDTLAMEEFQELYRREAYPGLGTVKKLSIMHHLETIGRYLDRE